MKKFITAVSTVAAATFIMTGSVFATPTTFVVCHKTESASNPYNRLELPLQAFSAHCTENGTPTAGHELDICSPEGGICPADPTPPAVPEFGLITGALALVTSAGSYVFLKKKIV